MHKNYRKEKNPTFCRPPLTLGKRWQMLPDQPHPGKTVPERSGPERACSPLSPLAARFSVFDRSLELCLRASSLPFVRFVSDSFKIALLRSLFNENICFLRVPAGGRKFHYSTTPTFNGLFQPSEVPFFYSNEYL